MEICMYCEYYNYCTGRCEVTGQKKKLMIVASIMNTFPMMTLILIGNIDKQKDEISY